MAEQPTYKFLPEDKCLTESQLFDYIDGKLKASDMHFIEKHILSCAFCSDALEGLEKVKDRDKVAAFISATTGAGKTAEKEEEKEKPKVIPLNPNRKYYALAAGLVLIIGITLFLKLSVSNGLENAKTAELVQKDSSVLMPPENQLAHADSLAQEKNAVVKTELGKMNDAADGEKSSNSKAPANGGISYFRTPALEERADQQPKAAKEAEPDRNADGDDLDHFVNVVDEKTNEQQESNDKSKLKNEGFANIEQKQKPAETDKKNKDVNRAADARTENEDVVLSEKKADVPPAPVIVSGTTTTNASGATPQTTSTPAYNYTWSGPTSTTSGTVMTTDSISYTVTKPESDHELDLSYENGVKMLAAGQATASLSLFDEVLKNSAHPHYQDAQWKKAEALIQLKRIEEAKKLLNEIAAKKGTYQEQAKAKLKTL
jgi:hypothetical protein